LKVPQVSLALEYLPLIRRQHESDEQKQQRIDMAQRLKTMKIMSNYHEVLCDQTRITPSYVAGLFDAEGHIGLTHGVFMSITQKSSPAILHAINHYFGSDRNLSRNLCVSFNGTKAVEVLTAIKPFACQKLIKSNWQRMFPLSQKPWKKRTAENLEEIDHLRTEVKRMKHS
jgi:hypothetical protein